MSDIIEELESIFGGFGKKDISKMSTEECIKHMEAHIRSEVKEKVQGGSK